MQVQGIDTSSTAAIQSLTPKTYTVNVQPGYNALGAPQIASMDLHCSGLYLPLGSGCNPNVLLTLNGYPSPNTDQTGDGYNFRGYTFSSPAPQQQNTYIARFDYNLTQSGTQRLFARLGMQGDHADLAEWMPGQPASTVNTNTSQGIVTGYSWTISVRREKALIHSGVTPPGNWFAPPGSNQSSRGGNKTAEASGAEGRFWRLGKHAGRNTSER